MDQCNHFRFVSIIARRFSTMSGMLFCAALMMGAPSLEASPYDVEITPDMLAEKPVYSPYAGRNYPDQVLFGDTHFHTNLSFDAGLVGTSLNVNDGFKFARGEEVTSSTGQPVKLSRPLDFYMITDHSDGMGFFNDLAAGKPDVIAFDQAKGWYEGLQKGGEASADAALDLIVDQLVRERGALGELHVHRVPGLAHQVVAHARGEADDRRRVGERLLEHQRIGYPVIR